MGNPQPSLPSFAFPMLGKMRLHSSFLISEFLLFVSHNLIVFCAFNLGETCWECSAEADEVFQPKADQLFLLEILSAFEGAVEVRLSGQESHEQTGGNRSVPFHFKSDL